MDVAVQAPRTCLVAEEGRRAPGLRDRSMAEGGGGVSDRSGGLIGSGRAWPHDGPPRPVRRTPGR